MWGEPRHVLGITYTVMQKLEYIDTVHENHYTRRWVMCHMEHTPTEEHGNRWQTKRILPSANDKNTIWSMVQWPSQRQASTQREIYAHTGTRSPAYDSTASHLCCRAGFPGVTYTRSVSLEATSWGPFSLLGEGRVRSDCESPLTPFIAITGFVSLKQRDRGWLLYITQLPREALEKSSYAEFFAAKWVT